MSDQDNLGLLLADCRQALFDAVKADDGAGNMLRHEIGRAVGLMGRAMDAIKPVATMQVALQVCANTFREYQILHHAKRTPEADQKAARNAEMAELCEQALAAASAKPHQTEENLG